MRNGNDETNWLVEYMKSNRQKIRLSTAKMVAKYAKESMKTLFDGHEFPAQLEPSTPVKGKKKRTQPLTKSPVTARTSIEEIGRECTADHDDIHGYKAIVEPYYFQAGFKYGKATCMVCNLPFATEDNKNNPELKDHMEREAAIPKLPSSKNMVYVCPVMDVDKSDCGSFVCGPCGKAKLLATDEGTRKRRKRS